MRKLGVQIKKTKSSLFGLELISMLCEAIPVAQKATISFPALKPVPKHWRHIAGILTGILF
jgi:hypothetical protein